MTNYIVSFNVLEDGNPVPKIMPVVADSVHTYNGGLTFINKVPREEVVDRDEVGGLFGTATGNHREVVVAAFQQYNFVIEEPVAQVQLVQGEQNNG